LRVYLIDRASRIYSVALPAMALTLAVAALCFLVNRPYFDQEIAPLSNHAALRVTLNLTFLSQIWGFNTVQFADSPFWSLSYECLFYVAYGFIFYLRSTRRVLALIAWAVVAGPQVLFLFPLWLLGCALYDGYQAIRRKPSAGILRTITLLYVGAAVTLGALGHTELILAPVHLDRAMAALPNPLLLIHENSIRATTRAVANGTLAAAAMFLLLLLSDLVSLARNHPCARRFRRIANGTFTIYLMHYPLMMLARSVNLLRANAPILGTVSVSGIVLMLIAIAGPVDTFKSKLRSTLGKARLSRRALASRPVPTTR
jgi:peptidoglycan/LPS O-acetylase OafA/YrhL